MKEHYKRRIIFLQRFSGILHPIYLECFKNMQESIIKIICRGVEIEKNFPHHGAVAFGNFGKTLYEVFKYVGVPVEEIGYNQPAGVRYPTENPWG